MLKPLLIIAGLLAAITFGVYAQSFFSRTDGLRPPEVLAREALEGADPAVQERAALDLARSGEPARDYLRRVLADGKSPEVKAAVIQGLEALKDWTSMPELIEALADPSEQVREQANAAVTSLLGADFRFRAADPPAARAKAVKAIQRAYEVMRKNPPPQYRSPPS